MSVLPSVSLNKSRSHLIMSATNASPSDIDRMEQVVEAMRASVKTLHDIISEEKELGGLEASIFIQGISEGSIKSMQDRITSLASGFRGRDEYMKEKEEKLQSEEAAAIQKVKAIKQREDLLKNREEAAKQGEELLSKGKDELKQQQEVIIDHPLSPLLASSKLHCFFLLTIMLT